jgi:alpha-galactosidase
MMGRIGYDIRVNNFTSKELQFSNDGLKTYNRISDVIWQPIVLPRLTL